MLSRNLIILFFLFIFSFFIFPASTYASITVNYTVTSGTDATEEEPAEFKENDITKLSSSDDSRIQSNKDSWTIGENYDESKYLEFVFNADVPEDATIESVTLSHEFRRSGSLTAAKLKIWDGANFTGKDLTVGTTNVDHTDTTENLSSFIDTPEKVNNLKVRFLAYRDEGQGGGTKTSHDFIGLSITYTVPESTISGTVYSQLYTGDKYDISQSPWNSNKGSIFYKPAVIPSSLWTYDFTSDASISFYTIGPIAPNILRIKHVSGASCSEIASSNGGFGLAIFGRNVSDTDESALVAIGGTDLGGGICQYALVEGVTLADTAGYKLSTVSFFYPKSSGLSVVLNGASANSGQSAVKGQQSMAPGASIIERYDGGIAFQLCIDYCDQEFILPAACSDGIKNQDETDIDFGGECVKAGDDYLDLNKNGTIDEKENEIIINSNTTLTAGEYNFKNLNIINGAILTLEGDPLSSDLFKGVKINATNLTINFGSAISADSKGFGPNAGPGISQIDSQGASYGGGDLLYGSAAGPVDLGSGGATYGGGAVRIVVSDTFTNNGIVSANGNSSSSGGSIYVTTSHLAGDGKFSGNGGVLYATGYFKSPGAGGRIALHYQTSSFEGEAEAKGGCGSYDSWTLTCALNGTVGIFDESKKDLYITSSWQFRESDGPFALNNIFVSGSAKVLSEEGVEINANSLSVNDGSYFYTAENQILNIPTITLEGGSMFTLSGGEEISADTFLIKGNSTVTVLSKKILYLKISDLTIEDGSYISADEKGYAPNQGSGASSVDVTSGIGASYGGFSYGGAAYSTTYGSETEPLDLGSGGATYGGGAIRLYVSSVFANNGTVSANGNSSSSGGSIYVTANNLSGSGKFSANGGGLYFTGYFKSPGGGGRIALYHETSSLFTGTAETKGGCGSYDGFSASCASGGTVVIKQKNFLPSCSDGIKNQDETGVDTGGICFVASSEKSITSFSFAGLSPAVAGVVDKANHTISLTVPFGTAVTALAPTIAISTGASIAPDNNVAKDFTNPVTFTVTAEDGTTQAYTVTVVPFCTENCNSNILFLPGIMGSRLYEEGLECGDVLTGPGCGGDKEMWFSSFDSDQEKLALNSEGKSINSLFTKNDTQIITKGEKETGITDSIKGSDIYKSFINDLKDWKDDGTIQDYAFIPYDWRLSLEDIITNGVSSLSGDLYYTAPRDFSESFVLQKLEELQASSKSGKVTIISHSNGGLVTKALIQKLKDTGNPLYEKIDKVIFVAVPQIGTPDALVALLHGNSLGFGFVMSAARHRELAENMPTAYHLLPSASYFTTVDPAFAVDKLVSFEDGTIFSSQISQYGVFVSNATELKNYVLGTDGRSKPSFSDVMNPNIGNSALYAEAEAVHQVLDSWQPHSDTKVIQIAGWGEETMAGLDCKSYVASRTGITRKAACKPRKIIDGDGRVVVPSALWMSDSNPNVERWWVNLEEEGGTFSTDREHKDILEISNLRDFIKKRIKNETFIDLDNIIVDNDSTLVSNKTRLHFTLHSPLTLCIIDSQGRYTGLDPDTGEIREEIPGATYEQIGEMQFISVPAGIAYTLQLQGYEDGLFTLEVDEQISNEVTESISFEGIESSTLTLVTMDIAPDSEVSTSELQIDTDGNGNVDQIYQIVDGEA
ncbi:MAG: DUF5018 domain-containing protein, partial [Patescibacteria group bacterium]